MDDASSCVVCLEPVKPADAIWHCRDGCFIEVHLLCAQRAAAVNLNGASKLVGQLLGSPEVSWFCPHCRHAYQDYPSEYRCYCGGAKNPPLDAWLSPHCCGGTCKGKRNACAHHCLDQCHPGPHPPCVLAIKQQCFCGKKQETVRCGTAKSPCGQPCGKAGLQRRVNGATDPTAPPASLSLSLCSHGCKSSCHDGNCPPCAEIVSAPCACGKETKRLPCTARIWRCKGACPKGLLSCGRCPCPLGCHNGPCPPCPNSSRRTCGCGKEAFEGLPCDAPTPLCGETCSKKLPGCDHSCQERCHAGPCPPCMAVVDARCRCGKSTKRKVCSAVEGGHSGAAAAGEEDDRDDARAFLCSLRCQGMMSCGRHQCKRRCCDGSAEAHACREVCTRKLGCGLHNCGRRCHAINSKSPSGGCGACPLTVTLSCPCGGTRKTFPCGKAPPPGTAIPCRLPCKRHSCCSKHEQKRHACHTGLCPPCDQACGEVHSRCGHPCSLPCHSQLLTVDTILAATTAPSASMGAGADPLLSTAAGATAFPALPQQAAASAVAAAVAMAKAPTPCPPCSVPIERCCVGGHETRAIPCSAPALFKCDNPCGHPLPCGRHSCPKACHGSRGAGCGPCLLKCSEPRPEGCSHPCSTVDNGACHAFECQRCVKPVERTCLCGRTLLALPCHEALALVSSASASASASLGDEEESAAALFLLRLRCDAFDRCGKTLKSCSHLCGHTPGCHSGACEELYDCQQAVAVQCPCATKKEDWPCAKVRSLLRDRALAFEVAENSGFRLLDCNLEEGCRAKPVAVEVPTSKVKPPKKAEKAEKAPSPAPAPAPAPRKQKVEPPVAQSAPMQPVERPEVQKRKRQEEAEAARAAKLTAQAAAEAAKKAEDERQEALRKRRMLILQLLFGLLFAWLVKMALGF